MMESINTWFLLWFQSRAACLQSIESLHGITIQGCELKFVFERFKLMFEQMINSNFYKTYRVNIFFIFKQ